MSERQGASSLSPGSSLLLQGFHILCLCFSFWFLFVPLFLLSGKKYPPTFFHPGFILLTVVLGKSLLLCLPVLPDYLNRIVRKGMVLLCIPCSFIPVTEMFPPDFRLLPRLLGVWFVLAFVLAQSHCRRVFFSMSSELPGTAAGIWGGVSFLLPVVAPVRLIMDPSWWTFFILTALILCIKGLRKRWETALYFWICLGIELVFYRFLVSFYTEGFLLPLTEAANLAAFSGLVILIGGYSDEVLNRHSTAISGS